MRGKEKGRCSANCPARNFNLPNQIDGGNYTFPRFFASREAISTVQEVQHGSSDFAQH